jgi:glycosyltransferase involved in cell wall biosynthesis
VNIREKVENAEMILIGPDPDEWVGRRIKSLGIGEHVTKLDPIPYIDLPVYISRADIGYALFPPNPLRTYAFPMKVIEYMAGGLAVIGPEDTETEIILERFGCGLAIPYDVEAYVNAVVDLFSKRSELERMAGNGVKGARLFDWDLLMEDLYQNIEEVYRKKEAVRDSC